jgi:hypothetical protein
VANLNNETLLLVFVACTGAAVLMQAFVLLAMYFAFRKAIKMAQQQIDELRTDVVPVVKETKQLLINVGPKIESVAVDFAALTHGVRTQGALIRTSTADIVERVNRQASRLDRMLTGVLDVADRAAEVFSEAMSVPLRQLSAIAAFAKAAIGSFRAGTPRPPAESQPAHSAADKDLLV